MSITTIVLLKHRFIQKNMRNKHAPSQVQINRKPLLFHGNLGIKFRLLSIKETDDVSSELKFLKVHLEHFFLLVLFTKLYGHPL